MRVEPRDPAGRQQPLPVERAFRIYLQQVATERSAGTGTELLLRIGIPVFVAPFERDSKPLHVVLTREGEQLQLLVSNPANHHWRLLRVRWQGGDGVWTEIDTRPVYVLARSGVRFSSPLPSQVGGGEPHAEGGRASRPGVSCHGTGRHQVARSSA